MRMLPRLTRSEAASALGRAHTPLIGDVVLTKGGIFGLWAGTTKDERHGWMIPLQPDTGLPVSPRRALFAVFHEEIQSRETLDDGEQARTVYLWLARAEELYPQALTDVVTRPMPALSRYISGDVLVDPSEPDSPFQVLLLHRGAALVQGMAKLPNDVASGQAHLWPMMCVPGAAQVEMGMIPLAKLSGMLLAEYTVLEPDWLNRFLAWLHKPRRGSCLTSRVGCRMGTLVQINGPSEWTVQWEGSSLLEQVVPEQVTVCGWRSL